MLPVMLGHMHQLDVLPLVLESLKGLLAPGERALDPRRPLCMLSQDVQPKVSGTGPCNTTVLTHRRFVLATVYLMHVYGQAQLGLSTSSRSADSDAAPRWRCAGSCRAAGGGQAYH